MDEVLLIHFLIDSSWDTSMSLYPFNYNHILQLGMHEFRESQN